MAEICDGIVITGCWKNAFEGFVDIHKVRYLRGSDPEKRLVLFGPDDGDLEFAAILHAEHDTMVAGQHVGGVVTKTALELVEEFVGSNAGVKGEVKKRFFDVLSGHGFVGDWCYHRSDIRSGANYHRVI